MVRWEIERSCWREGLRVLVGVDEAGRGPLAGPVVAAAVHLPYELCRKMPKVLSGLNDSKQVSESDRETLYSAMTELGLPIGVGIVSNLEIDEINILQGTMKAMTLAVESLCEKFPAQKIDLLLVDGNYFRTSLGHPFQTFVKGDARSPTIAAASIVAKVTRDRIMHELHDLYPAYNFARHKGYATKEHREAIERYGLSPVHRRSFRSPATKIAITKNFVTKKSAAEILVYTELGLFLE